MAISGFEVFISVPLVFVVVVGWVAVILLLLLLQLVVVERVAYIPDNSAALLLPPLDRNPDSSENEFYQQNVGFYKLGFN